MIKKIIIILICFLLCSCSDETRKEADLEASYSVMIDMIKEYDNFQTFSNYFDISREVAKIDNGYRYYIVIDNPRVAMYDIEAIAIEKNKDYSKTMAANIGLFEDKDYNMIPNQKDVSKGFVEGLVISGISDNPNPTLYVLVKYKSKDLNVNHYEYLLIEDTTQE